MNLMPLLFGFHGRVRRSTWWLTHLACTGVAVVLVIVLFMAAGVSGGRNFDGPGAELMLLIFPLLLVAAWIGLALGIKRCHDRDYPGVMILIMFVPLLGSLWALIDLGFIDGTPGPNRYGPSPKGLGETAATFA